MFGSFLVSIDSFRHLRRKLFKSCILDKVSARLALFFGTFSLFMLYCPSIDRYFRVTKMNRYNLYMNNFRMKLMIVIGFVISMVLTLVGGMRPSFVQRSVGASVGIFFLSFAIVVYVLVLRRLQSHVRRSSKLRRIGPNSQGTANNCGTDAPGNAMSSTDETAPKRPQENGSSQLSAIKMVRLLLIFLSISYTPYHIVSCWWTYYKYHKKTDPGFNLTLSLVWSVFVALLNPSVNSWIIIFGNSRSRRFVLSLFRRNRVSNISED